MSLMLKDLIKPTTVRKILSTKNHCYPLLLRNKTQNAEDEKKPNLKGEGVGEPKILVSDSCVSRLRDICRTDKGTFLRVMVEGGGCSGFQYKFNLDKSMKEDDLVFGEEDAKVVIDKLSLEFCNGATVDYHIELIRSGFRITANPLAEQGCSCGSSFAVRMD